MARFACLVGFAQTRAPDDLFLDFCGEPTLSLVMLVEVRLKQRTAHCLLNIRVQYPWGTYRR